jgi:hypothetical protein
MMAVGRLTLRDDDDADGYFWSDVRDALRDSWPTCDMNDGISDSTRTGSDVIRSTVVLALSD